MTGKLQAGSPRSAATLKAKPLPRIPHPSWRHPDDASVPQSAHKPDADEFWARIGI